MRRGKDLQRVIAHAAACAAFVCLVPTLCGPAHAIAKSASTSNVTLGDGKVVLQSNKSTRLNMYLPNSGALAGRKSSAVLAADFSIKKAGTAITIKSGYHARNRKAIAGYLAAHSPYEQGWRGSLSAHWAGEADLYNDIRQGGFQALPSIELEGLHELGIKRTLESGLTMGITARSRNDRQSITATMGYKRGRFSYDGVLTKAMFGAGGLSGHQRMKAALGKLKVDGGVLMRTARSGAFETFPYMTAKFNLSGLGVKAAYERSPKLRLAGRPVERTQLSLTKSFMEGRLKLSSEAAMRSTALTQGLLSSNVAVSFSSPKDNGKLSWRFGGSALHLSGGATNDVLAFDAQTGTALRSTLSALDASTSYKINKKTNLTFKASGKYLSSDMGEFQRFTLSSHVKHGLWDFEAMAGLNRANANDAVLVPARGSLHHFIAQRSFGQFSDQRAIFSLKAKYSY